MERPDGPFKFRKLISRDSKLQFGSFIHANPNTFNTEPAFPRLPDNRTYGGRPETDAIDPNGRNADIPPPQLTMHSNDGTTSARHAFRYLRSVAKDSQIVGRRPLM
jgi:hypothetical protein